VGRTKRVATQKRIAPFYSVHPSVAMMQAWIADLYQKTGRTLDEWIDLVQEEGPEPERRTWLKAKHGLGTNASWWIAQRAEGKGMEDGTRKPISRRPKAMWRQCSKASGRDQADL